MQLVQLVLKAHKELQVQLVQRELQVHKAQQVLQEQMVLTVGI